MPLHTSATKETRTDDARSKKPCSDEGSLLNESLVLYFDILGVKELFPKSCNAEQIGKNISRLYRVLDSIRKKLDIRERNGVTIPETLASALFSDSFYVVSSIGLEPTDFESELYGQFFTASECQTILLENGFFARGGIAKGLTAVENNFICGPACVFAASFDRHGMPPVIMVDKQLLWDSYWGSCKMICATTNPTFCLFGDSWVFKLLYDKKGDIFFFNYMEDWFSLCTDSLSDGSPECYQLLEKNLERQKMLIEDNISRFEKPLDSTHVLEKYYYLANFHNFVLRSYCEFEEFRSVAKYVVVPQKRLPPLSIAWARPYLKKFIIEKSYEYGHQKVDDGFIANNPMASESRNESRTPSIPK